MTRRKLLWVVPAAAVLLFVLPMGAAAQAVNSPDSLASFTPQGAVFTMTNDASGNAVLAYVIGPGGSLIPAGDFGAHAKGSGVNLGDQGALALTDDHHWLLVVDAGSNAVSVFHVNSLGGNGPILSFADEVSSHGTLPLSVTVHGSLVYVLNAGTSLVPGNIFGFFLNDHGKLSPIAGSSRPLSTSASVSPAQISFNPSGTVLVVAEKNTSFLDSYTVGDHGYASGPTVTPSSGATPFGFGFGRGGVLVVSEAGPGALSSYEVAHSGALSVESATVVDGQKAACWVATIDDGHYAYTTNAHSGTISTYGVGSDGALTVLAAVAATTGPADTDLAVGGAHSHYLFVYDRGASEVQEFAIGSSASLTLRYDVFGFPATAEGLAAF
jgi:6-phosphogluconolactonase